MNGRILVAFAIVFLGASLRTQAVDTYTWTTVDQSWFRNSNWTGGAAGKVPGVGSNGATTVYGSNSDIALFSTAAAPSVVFVNFDSSSNNGNGNDSSGNGTLTLGAIAWSSTASTSLTIGPSSSANGILTLTGATVNGVPDTILSNASSLFEAVTGANVNSLAGQMTIRLGDATDNVIQSTGTGRVTLVAPIQDGAGNHLTFMGSSAGSLSLRAVETYTGGTTIQSGTLQVAASGLLPSTGVLNVTGGTVDLVGLSQTIGALTGNGGLITNTNGSSAQNFTIGNGGGSGTYSGTIGDTNTQAFALTKTGNGTQTLSGLSRYAQTIINGGTLLMDGHLVAPGGTNTGLVTVNAGGTLGGSGIIDVGGTGTGVTINNGARITGGTVGGIGTLTLPPLNFIGSNAQHSVYLVDLNGASGDSLTVGGAISLNSSSFDEISFSGMPDGITTYKLMQGSSIGGIFDIVSSLPANYTLRYLPTELDLVPVPEPATWLTGVGAVIGVLWVRRTRVKSR